MILNELRDKMIKFYNITDTTETPFQFIENKEQLILNLLYIINYLNHKNYTLTHICLSDFVLLDKFIILNKDTHLVKLDSKNYFRNVYEENKDDIEFPTKHLKQETRISLNETYKSVGLFVYYLYLDKIKDEVNENDLQKINGTKPYYFIKNTVYKIPYIIYL
jgi:hypothetical protein